jgi:uncharacterized membrane protein YbhN (UPF0104 family)
VAKIGLIIILSVIALILIVVGVGFFISSLYLYLAVAFNDSRLAAFFCGLALVLVAILLLLIMLLIKSKLFKFRAPKIEARLEAIRDNPGAEALHLVQKYPYRSAFVALGSGFLLGFSSKLRDSLIDGAATYLNTGSLAESLKSMKSGGEDDDKDE